LPGLIETLETEQREVGDRLAGSEIYQGDSALLTQAQDRYAQIEAELMTALDRWEQLGAA
jgi:ATP-binding cassette subfamily F protein uup